MKGIIPANAITPNADAGVYNGSTPIILLTVYF